MLQALNQVGGWVNKEGVYVYVATVMAEGWIVS